MSIVSIMIQFKPLSPEDYRQLHHWLQCPHVRLFWDDGDRTVEQVEAHYLETDSVSHYVFYINEKAAGFIQSYAIDATHDYAHFVQPYHTTLGIDFFIGNQDYLGRGYASVILKQFMASYCQGIDAILVDPEADNHKAIHIYQKLGFVKIAEYYVKTQLHWLMIAQLNEAP